MADGFGSAIAALFNSMPTTSFGQNVGLIAMTKVINRNVVGIELDF
ncbi:solute carrier family 23 protein [Paraclostridium bifermentans]|nr:solute carrier family 23 protein [Paraclostridium bifermentans]